MDDYLISSYFLLLTHPPLTLYLVFYCLFYQYYISIMLNRKKWKTAIEKQQKKSTLLTWLEKELCKVGYDLSDNYCRFYIKNKIQQRGQSLIIQIYLMPLNGIFQSIEFKPKIFIKHHNFATRPRIYNDRRLFHPNINMLTCELVFPQLVKEWNPTQQFATMLQNLKYTIIEPNLKFVPNTQFNKKAAWNYYFNKKNYRNLIIENSPLYLEQIIGLQFDYQHENRMQIQGNANSSNNNSDDHQNFWSIETITIRKTNDETHNILDQEEIILLTKSIKSLNMCEMEQEMFQF